MRQTFRREAKLTVQYCAVSLIGFGVDLAVLHLMLWVGLTPAWARVVSLACAMHVTFVLNGVHVFRQLERRRWLGQWASYMACNGFGNVCNYWIFVSLVSTHWPVMSNPTFGVAAGSVCAWAINFTATRFVVFRRRPSPSASPCPGSDPSQASPESPPR